MTDNFLQDRLEDRAGQGMLRSLSPDTSLVDFASNDYLGFARSDALIKSIKDERITRTGSTGSRLLTGNSSFTEELERFVASYHRADAGLIYNSGYDANLGLLSSAATKGDVILYDELSHASIYDGVRLSKADSFPFRHNDANHLRHRLEAWRTNTTKAGNCFIVVESVYSMGGDFAPLVKIAQLAEDFGANLIVDEAHATGLFGNKGEGKVVELGLEKKVFARVHTFGKALGCHGAIVIGSDRLRNYLINFSRSFIYTTALPEHSLAAIRRAYDLLSVSSQKSENLHRLTGIFREAYQSHSVLFSLTESYSPIQSVVIPGNGNARRIAAQVQADGYDVRPILSPTVPKGKERIRLCLHTFNTEKEIAGLIASLKTHAAEYVPDAVKAV